MNKGGGGEIQRSQVNPRPLGKKKQKKLGQYPGLILH